MDLYLIHNPRLAQPDIPTAWAKMEKIKADGLAKCALFFPLYHTCSKLFHRSIGVSNFRVPELQTLVNSAKILPAANQVCTPTFD